MWFRKQSSPPAPLTESHGFTLGQLVQHKIDGRRFVIVEFYENSEGPKAFAAYGSLPTEECEMSVYEIEPIAPAAAEGQ